MTRSIFNKSFKEVFTTSRLLYELSLFKPIPKDILQVQKEIKEGKFFESAPKKSFYLPKNDGSFREIVLSQTKTKVIQKVLAAELGYAMHFSDRNYAFRKGKSPYKAISRVKDTLKRYSYIAKADIQTFFDAIEHTILIKKLNLIVSDKQIVHLIAYYLSQGTLQKNQWVDKSEGVYQGDVLSPLLSNIYLNDFDFYLERENIEFVRYADDMLFFGKNKTEVSAARKKASDYLAKIHLRFNPKKTYLSNIDKGFEYLGVRFVENTLSIDTIRLSKKITKLKSETKHLSLELAIEKLNQKVVGFKNYYAKLIDDEAQMKMLQDALDDVLIEKIVYAKQHKIVHSKLQIKTLLEPMESYISLHHRHWVDGLISTAYGQIEVQTPLASAQKKVASEKRTYLQKQIKSSEIVVSEVGAFLGFSQGKIKVKLKGKVVMQAPINRIKRVVS